MMVPLRLLHLLLVAFVVLLPTHSYARNVEFEYESLVNDYPDVQPLHNQFYDYLSYYEPDLSHTTLRKCFCGLDEIWNGTTCEKQKTLVAVYDYYHSGLSVVVNTTAFGNVMKGEASCSERTKLLELGKTPNHNEQFFVLETGELEWNQMVFQSFCIEHTYGSTGIPNEWFAQICLGRPTVPRCCPKGQSLDAKGQCITQGATNFSPPIRVLDQVMTWPEEDAELVKNIACRESEDTLVLELGNSTLFLDYHQSMPFLKGSSPFVIRHQQGNLSYCVGVDSQNKVYSAKLCYKDPKKDHQEKCQGNVCVRKCCKDYEYPSLDGCQPYPSDNITLFNPTYHDPYTFSKVDEPENVTLVHGLPLCKEFFQLRPHEESDDTFFLLQNGYLHASAFPDPYPPTDYCIDSFVDPDQGILMMPLVCFHEEDKNAICENLQKYLYPALLIVSIVFLGVTLVVYIFVPELHAKVHGKCLLSHVSALLMAYVSLFIVQRTTSDISHFGCKFIASVTHFSFLAAFFWLNVMCFDIWWTLKSMRPVPETGELSRLRFKLYSLYSWGCPLVIAVVSAIIQSLPESVKVIRPNFGDAKCWFSKDVSLWAYFYGFVLVLVIANIIFFCQVAYILIVAQNDPILQRTRQQDRERMGLYVKLFMVMGITWLAEVISWQEKTCEAWIITDIINSLQGVSIFIIFICKRNLLKKVRSKWEPYLRHVKEVVGSKRLSHSKFSTSGNGTTTREQLSFSSTENRPNHSAASHRTVECQLSYDPSSVNRKISTGSLTATTGAQIHMQNSIPMDTIDEQSGPENCPHPTHNGFATSPLDKNDEKYRDQIDTQNRDGNMVGIQEEEHESLDGQESGDCRGDEEIQVSCEEDSSQNSGEKHREHFDDEKKEPLSNDDSLVKESEGLRNEKKKENDDKCEVTVNATTIEVNSPNEETNMGTQFSCSFAHTNHNLTGEEDDEPIHV
ncbi:uncharacterized protein [Macrobrachium rosenbergii]|uniref:uncharacterized protein isoform X2 n=1 Tax=Macrobrachium rosenbergii TaxID=79674 RepID=UPI0034D43E9A